MLAKLKKLVVVLFLPRLSSYKETDYVKEF